VVVDISWTSRSLADDFGTGYSSLSYFKKIPADELKIDKSFVMNMATDASDQQLVRTIIELARHFKLEVVAEGVENRATFMAWSRHARNEPPATLMVERRAR
jgi:EAL domain-containing protein (putative c-di-GMP-specific phosphodiesterase class I)